MKFSFDMNMIRIITDNLVTIYHVPRGRRSRWPTPSDVQQRTASETCLQNNQQRQLWWWWGRTQGSDYHSPDTVFRLLTGHSDQLLHSKCLLAARYVHGRNRLHVLKEKQSCGEDDMRSMWINNKTKVREHLPLPVSWRLGADGRFSKGKRLTKAFMQGRIHTLKKH